MRLPKLLAFALATAVLAPSSVLASECAPARAEPTKVPFRPRAWSPPSAPTTARSATGMIEGDPTNLARPGSRAAALERIVVEVHPDGSRHAVLGGAIGAWSVAGVDERGRLHVDCVGSEAEAKARVREAGRRGGK